MFYSMLETCRSQLSATLIKTTCFGVRSQQQKTGYAPATPAKSECATLRGSPRPSTAEFITSLRANRTLQIVAVQQSDTFTREQHSANWNSPTRCKTGSCAATRTTPKKSGSALQQKQTHSSRDTLTLHGLDCTPREFRLRDGYTKSHKI